MLLALNKIQFHHWIKLRELIKSYILKIDGARRVGSWAKRQKKSQNHEQFGFLGIKVHTDVKIRHKLLAVELKGPGPHKLLYFTSSVTPPFRNTQVLMFWWAWHFSSPWYSHILLISSTSLQISDGKLRKLSQVKWHSCHNRIKKNCKSWKVTDLKSIIY